MTLRTDIKADIALILLSILWGLSFPLVKIALAECGVFTFLSLRFLLAGIMIIPFYLRSGVTKGSLKHLNLLPLGLSIFTGFALQAWGLSLTKAANSGFITGTLVVMVPFLAMPVLGSRLKFRHLVSAFTAMAGIFLITRPGFSRLNTGDLLTLFCALAFAFQTVMVQKVGNRGNSLHLTLYQILFIAIFSIPIAGLVEGFRGIASLKVWALAGTVGLTSTGLAFWLQAHFQPLTSAQTAAVIYSLEPVFAALFANLILNEDLPQPLGAGLIIAGMILAEWKRR